MRRLRRAGRGRRPGDEHPPADVIDLRAAEHAWWADLPPEDHDDDDSRDNHDDPYGVLRVDPSASWEDIVAAYHRLARWWHPDGLADPAPVERELCEDKIRQLNVAYSELRIRRRR